LHFFAVEHPAQLTSSVQTGFTVPYGSPIEVPHATRQRPRAKSQRAPSGHAFVGEQNAQTWLLHAVAPLPGAPQALQSSSVVQLAGHFRTHVPALQTSFDWQFSTFWSVQPTHAPVATSQTRNFGPHAAQSASARQLTLGAPLGSSSHEIPSGAHAPYFVQ
jgi:hypothetical protein